MLRFSFLPVWLDNLEACDGAWEQKTGEASHSRGVSDGWEGYANESDATTVTRSGNDTFRQV